MIDKESPGFTWDRYVPEKKPRAKLKITLSKPPEPIRLNCKRCGEEYTEWPNSREERLVDLCMECSFPRGRFVGPEFNFHDYDLFVVTCPMTRMQLFYRQSFQIAATLRALEDECSKKPLSTK